MEKIDSVYFFLKEKIPQTRYFMSLRNGLLLRSKSGKHVNNSHYNLRNLWYNSRSSLAFGNDRRKSWTNRSYPCDRLGDIISGWIKFINKSPTKFIFPQKLSIMKLKLYLVKNFFLIVSFVSILLLFGSFFSLIIALFKPVWGSELYITISLLIIYFIIYSVSMYQYSNFAEKYIELVQKENKPPLSVRIRSKVKVGLKVALNWLALPFALFSAILILLTLAGIGEMIYHMSPVILILIIVVSIAFNK